MKVRTCLLFACMIIVPGLAMFSHRVPAEIRSATRCAIWDPILSWAEAWNTPKPEALVSDGPAEGPVGMTTAAVVGPVASQTGRLGPQDAIPRAEGLGRVSAAGQSSQTSIERLATLGALAVECRPLDGVAGTHVASCQVAMDAAGQLHRVFQAPGPTPDEAFAALAADVEDWRMRLATRASRPPAANGATRF